MTTVSTVLLALLLPITVFDLLRRPTIRRLGIRNLTRRRGETVLVIGGTMLATALITASFVIGDSFDSSIRTIAETRFGPIDELVVTESPEEADTLAQAINSQNSPTFDGAMSALRLDVAAGSVARAGSDNRTVEPFARAVELDPSTASMFGGDAASTGLGLLVDGLAPDRVVINEQLAADLGLEANDPIDLFVQGRSTRFTVHAVVPVRGLAGFSDVVLTPGVLSSQLEDLQMSTTAMVYVSNAGDVYSGASRTGTAVAELESIGARADAITSLKSDLLEDAAAEGRETTELFGTIGGFSVIAGILLVVNLFAMLSAERRTDIGTMRAIGIKQGTIVRSFALEGAAYGILASAVGSVVGIGLGAAVLAYARTTLPPNADLTLALSVHGASIFSGALIGLAISQLTVVATVLRSTRLTIVRAIKDIGEAPREPRPRRSIVVGLLGLSISATVIVLGFDTQGGALVGPVFAALSLIPIAKVFLPTRAVSIAACSAGVVWAAAVIGIESETMADPDIGVFLGQGVILVGLSSVIVANLDDVWRSLASRVSGGSVASRLGLAHPLDRPVRSVMLVAMFALVLFTVAFMSVLNAVFNARGPDLAERAAGDYSVLVDANGTAGFETDELASFGGVTTATAIGRFEILVSETGAGPDSNTEDWVASLIEPDFVDTTPPDTIKRDEAFASDELAWAAVADGTTVGGAMWIMAPDNLDVDPGTRLTIIGEDDRSIDVIVAGVTEQQWLVEAGIFVSNVAGEALSTEPISPTRFYVTTASDPQDVVDALNAAAPERGISASTFLSNAQDELAGQDGFLKMLQGYLGVGLIIGVVGLGVVLFRAVRERRREIGMLRAMGFPQSSIRGMFVVESLFIGLQGVLLGVGLGTLSAWQVLTKSAAFETGLEFVAPVSELGAISAGALVLAVLSAVAPALRSGRESPASALRFAA